MSQALNLGIAGLGTVGASVAHILHARSAALSGAAGRAIRISAVAARDRTRDRGVDLSLATWHTDPVALAQDPDVDVVVELMGGAEGAALATVEAALRAGKAVVTANKALLAAHGPRLAALAEEKGVALCYEAAVAGGIPIVKTLREAMVASRLTRVYGILNGTCNFILTRMEEEGASFEAALAEAQRLGYAEADPTFDVGGFDTAHKLAILTSIAFGSSIDAESIYVEGIAAISPLDLAMAAELGYRIKLLGVATRTDEGIEQRVHPTMVPRSSSIAQVMGVLNAVAIDGDAIGDLTLVGPGAGGKATASAVISDIVDIARGIVRPTFGVPAGSMSPPRRAPMQYHEGGYYIRFFAYDRPGAAASIATRMAEQGISLESILQRRPKAKATEGQHAAGSVPVVLITHATTEAAVRAALDAVLQDGYVDGVPQVIRIEKE